MKPTDYLTSDRRGREAHDLELEAQCDPFLAEALQGMEETPGDHHEAIESLRLRITERASREAHRLRLRRIRQWTAAAAVVLLLATAGFITWQRAPVSELPPAATLADGTLPPAAPTGTGPSTPTPRSETPEPSPRPDTDLSVVTAGTDRPTTADKRSGEQPATETRPTGHTSAGQAATDGRTGLRTHRDPQQQDLPDDTDAYPEHPAPDALSTDEFNHIVVTGYGGAQKAPYTGSAKKVETTVHSLMDDAETGEPEGPDGSATERGAKVTTKVLAEEFVWEGDGSASRPESEAVNTPGADGAFLVAEVMPLFREGDIYYKEFRQWVQARTRTPRRLRRDTTWQTMRVITSFVIDTTGRLIQPTVLRSPDSQLSRRALRILKRSPRWTPGRQADRAVPVKFTLPVDFHNPNYRPGKPDGPKRPAATQPAGKRSAATQSAGKQPATQPVATQPAREQR